MLQIQLYQLPSAARLRNVVWKSRRFRGGRGGELLEDWMNLSMWEFAISAQLLLDGLLGRADLAFELLLVVA